MNASTEEPRRDFIIIMKQMLTEEDCDTYTKAIAYQFVTLLANAGLDPNHHWEDDYDWINWLKLVSKCHQRVNPTLTRAEMLLLRGPDHLFRDYGLTGGEPGQAYLEIYNKIRYSALL